MKTQTTERPKQITVNVEGVIIGELKLKHDLNIPNPASSDKKVRRKEVEGVVYKWLTRQYPGREKSFSDVVVRIPDEEAKKEAKKQKPKKEAVHG